eukprot:8419687-Alexandrium_andersonii.AAC.1
MSASLVGSEMCIRDSPRRPYAQTSAAAELAAPPLCSAPASTRRPRRYSPCLLYTSDAADDM